MERQGRQRINLLLGFLLFLFSCNKVHENRNPYQYNTVLAKEVTYKPYKGKFYVNGERFSGSIYWTYPNNDTLRVKRYCNGVKEGQWSRYYSNGSLEEVRFYRNGKKEGKQIGYFPSGKIHFITFFENDLYEGNAKAWTIQGRLIKDQNYHLGKENGAQKVWYDNGKVKANYIIKEGRRYGLLGTKNCINVSNEAF